jgi:hypothetical protein
VEQNALIAAIVVIALIVIVALFVVMRRRKTDHLRERFGDEYERTVEHVGNRGKAEAALADREARVDALSIRPLSYEEHTRFAEEWRDVKSVFVDSPVEAVLHADRLVATMMKTVGYPMADFDRRYEDLTVDHADVASHYREGHAVIERHNGAGASTEEMRQAMKHYEALYDHLAADADRDGVADRPASAATVRNVASDRAIDLDREGDTKIAHTDRDRDGVRETVTTRRD